MKKILITGANSYIGTSFERWIRQWPENYQAYSLDLHKDEWKNHDFSLYDVVLHVAGIVHIKEKKCNIEQFYKVNRDLAYETASIARVHNVKQFIYMSTMSVYGMDEGVINKETSLNPKTHYGKSKLQAEEMLLNLRDENFKIVIVRPPMVYGKHCRGNYNYLSRFAKILPIFPAMYNERSMIYIDNLSEYIRVIIDNNTEGTFFPQNNEYVKITEMVQMIADIHGKKIYSTKLLNPFIKFLPIHLYKKIFGSLKNDIRDELDINQCSFEDSIMYTEDIKL
jgi:UDP-glucose 4-epimerase